jgi:hypothetical protein
MRLVIVPLMSSAGRTRATQNALVGIFVQLFADLLANPSCSQRVGQLGLLASLSHRRTRGIYDGCHEHMLFMNHLRCAFLGLD